MATATNPKACKGRSRSKSKTNEEENTEMTDTATEAPVEETPEASEVAEAPAEETNTEESHFGPAVQQVRDRPRGCTVRCHRAVLQRSGHRRFPGDLPQRPRIEPW